jgi:glucose/arabinose dehydrogenase
MLAKHPLTAFGFLFFLSGPGTARAQWKAEAAFPNLGFTNPTALVEAPRTGRIYVTEQEGRVYAFANDPAAARKILALDLSGQTQGGFGLEDCGLMGLAFHPDFGKAASPNRGYAYVYYNYSAKPVLPTSPTVKISDRTPSYDRLSRFTLPDGAEAFDPASELVLIDQKDQDTWHNGGGLFFHPKDGFLYLTNGDEGCNCGNTQKIDKSLFSGVLRLDVDMRGGAISHPIKRQPVDGVTAHYFIPNDNPFVGAQALEEFWSLGLRSPHRMTYDAASDLIFIGDVGAEFKEEIDVVRKAANFQWIREEGTAKNPKPADALGAWTNPVHEYLHDGGGAAVIGGYVYRGCANRAALGGKYLFADFVSNKVYALAFAAHAEKGAESKGVEELLTLPFRGDHGGHGVTSFGVDASEELYLLLLGQDTRIQKLSNPATKAACPATALAAATGPDRDRGPFTLRLLADGLEIVGDYGDFTATVASLDGKLLAQAGLRERFVFPTRGLSAGMLWVRIAGKGRAWNHRVSLSAAEYSALPSGRAGRP